MVKINSTNVSSDDLIIKAYGKIIGVFKRDRVLITIPFPISVFYSARKVELEYSKIIRMNLLQTNSDLSIYMAYNKPDGKTRGYSVGLGNELKTALAYFQSAVEIVKKANSKVEIHIAQGITKAIANQYAKRKL